MTGELRGHYTVNAIADTIQRGRTEMVPHRQEQRSIEGQRKPIDRGSLCKPIGTFG